VREALADEQVQARDMIIEVKHPVYGIIREVAAPIKTDGAITAPAPAPRLGEHPDEILRDLLHYGNEHIDGLRASDALGAPCAGEP
jgi:CoA:oxalate CoA-transferase